MKVIKLFFSSLFIFLVACNTQDKFEREDYLFRYLNEVVKAPINNDNQLIFLINNKACNCSGNWADIVHEVFAHSKQPKLIIMQQNDTSIINAINQHLENYKIIKDTAELLNTYGLGNATHYVFEIEKNKIKHWSIVSNETIEAMKIKFKNNH